MVVGGFGREVDTLAAPETGEGSVHMRAVVAGALSDVDNALVMEPTQRFANVLLCDIGDLGELPSGRVASSSERINDRRLVVGREPFDAGDLEIEKSGRRGVCPNKHDRLVIGVVGVPCIPAGGLCDVLFANAREEGGGGVGVGAYEPAAVCAALLTVLISLCLRAGVEAGLGEEVYHIVVAWVNTSI